MSKDSIDWSVPKDRISPRTIWADEQIQRAESIRKKLRKSNLDYEAKEYLEKLINKEVQRMWRVAH